MNKFLTGFSSRFIGFGKHSIWHGSGFHNIVLSLEAPLDFSRKDVHELGDAKLTIHYGVKNNRVTIRIGGNPVKPQKGKLPCSKQPKSHVLPYLALLTCIIEAKGRVSLHLPKMPSDDEIMVRCFEVHEGFASLRVEGISNLSLSSFDNLIDHLIEMWRKRLSTREVERELKKVASFFEVCPQHG